MSKRKSGVPPLPLAGTVAAGFEVVWMTALILLGVMLSEMIAKQPTHLGETIVFRDDGAPLVQSYTRDRFTGGVFQPYNYRTLDGEEVTITDNSGWPSGAGWLPSVSLWNPATYPLTPWGMTWSQRVQALNDPQQQAAAWFLVHDGKRDGSATIVGYDTATNARIGFIGTNGFRSDAVPESERFETPWRLSAWYGSTVASGQLSEWVVYMIAERRLYEVDLRSRSVRVVFDDPALPVISAGIIPRPAQRGRFDVDRLMIRGAGQVILLGPDGTRLRSVPVPAELENAYFSWYELDNSHALLQVLGAQDRSGKRRDMIYRIKPDGAVESKKEIDLQQFKYETGDEAFSGFEWTNAIALCLCPSPALLDAFFATMACIAPDAPPAAASDSPRVEDFWPALIGAHLLGAILAWVSLRRCVRFALSRSEIVAWSVFVLLLGLPGWIGFLVHRRWPVLDNCPSCTRRVPMDRDACAGCDVPLPAPALKGIEVFA